MNRFLVFSAFASILLLGFSSCKKDAAEPNPPVELSFPNALSMTYGTRASVTLPEDFAAGSGLSISFDFSSNENVAISSSAALRDRLASAISFDAQKQSIEIDGALLYPNGAVSTSNGKRIPDNYQVTVLAKAADGSTAAKGNFQFQVTEGKIGVKDVKSESETSFAYVLYSDQGASFELDALLLPTAGTSWYLPETTALKDIVSVDNATIKFSKQAGDAQQKAEQAYELSPTLLKDGIPVAKMAFRVIFIPQIKFFFGMYYPELNIMVNLNLLHIGLSNGYISSAPTLYPEKYKSTFQIVSVQKDGQAFDNSASLFTVNNSTGAVTVKKDDALRAGSYEILVRAITSTGLEFTTDLTLVMSAG